jgi:hypothetical protein
MKWKIVVGVFLLWVIAHFIPLDRTSVVYPHIVGNKEVDAILRRSCFDCHSMETKWPYYSYIFPVSLFLYQHVKEGREELNFSEWNEKSHLKQLSIIESMMDEIESGEMPLKSYLWMHDTAKLTEGDIEILRKWQIEMEEERYEEEDDE